MSDTGRANFKKDTSNSNENVGNRVTPILQSDLVHLTIQKNRNFFQDEIGHVYLKIDGLSYVDTTSNEFSISNENIDNNAIPILHSDLVHLTILENRNFFLDEIGHIYLKIDGLTYVDITSNEIKKVEKDDIFLDQFVHKLKAQFVL